MSPRAVDEQAHVAMAVSVVSAAHDYLRRGTGGQCRASRAEVPSGHPADGRQVGNQAGAKAQPAREPEQGRGEGGN